MMSWACGATPTIPVRQEHVEAAPPRGRAQGVGEVGGELGERCEARLAPVGVDVEGDQAARLEGDAYIGDVLKFPDCTLAISEPRHPCFKFAAVMGFNQAVKMMAQSGYCGFYLAVRVPGTIAAGESYELIPGQREVSIAELFKSDMRRKS